MTLDDLKRTIDCLTRAQRGEIIEIWLGTLLWAEFRGWAETLNVRLVAYLDRDTYGGIPIRVSKDIPPAHMH